MKKTLVVLGLKGITLPNYMGITTNHYKDPYNPTSIVDWDSDEVFVCSMAPWVCFTEAVCLVADRASNLSTIRQPPTARR